MLIINDQIACDVHARCVPPHYHPAIVKYTHNSWSYDFLCQRALDIWLDSADDDPDMEPRSLVFL